MTSQSFQVEEGITNYMDAGLYNAAMKGRIQSFSSYLQQSGSLQSLLTTKNNTVLHVYAQSIGEEKSDRIGAFLTPVLVNCPSLLQQPNDDGQTALHIAAALGRLEIVQFLIKQSMVQSQEDLESNGGDGAKAAREMLRKTDQEMNTALHLAVQNRDLDVVKALLEFEDAAGSFCYGANNRHQTPLYIAAASGDSSLVEAILDKFGSAAAHGGPHGRTALHAAAMRDAWQMVSKIVDKKGKFLTREADENGHTPLHYAAHFNRFVPVTELLECDKSVAFMGDKKWEMTPLLVAARQGHSEMVRKILRHCPRCCEKVDIRGWNVLHFLVARGLPIESLLKEIPSVPRLLFQEDALGITPYVLETLIKTKRRGMIQIPLEDFFNDEVAKTRVSVPITVTAKVEEDEDKKAESQLVAATLITTVAFAAAMTVPGGFKTDHEQAGTPFHLHKIAFQVFVTSDALAFALSLAAICRLLGGRYDINMSDACEISAALISYALIALAIAFSAGTYVVLKPTHALAIASCCIGVGGIFFYFSNLDKAVMISQKVILWIGKVIMGPIVVVIFVIWGFLFLCRWVLEYGFLRLRHRFWNRN